MEIDNTLPKIRALLSNLYNLHVLQPRFGSLLNHSAKPNYESEGLCQSNAKNTQSITYLVSSDKDSVDV